MKKEMLKMRDEFLEEMCEDLGIKVEDADENLKQIAMELAERYIKENK